ncbi:MAG: hypothetical protein ACPG46_01395 [Thalassotalea sp.]
MLDISCLSDISNQKSKSFHQEKHFIKQALNGKVVNCRSCQKKLVLALINQDTQLHLQCKKGCTDILLDING